jgi:S-adenosylmethionine:tRNA ribosyltransferase-isomerase
MQTSDFDYDLPAERIAQTPVEPRDASRLMILDRQSDEIRHAHFYQLGGYLHAGDILVMNETRVIPARLYGKKVPSGGRVEILLLNKPDETEWEVLAGGKGLRVGVSLRLDGGLEAEIVRVLDGPRRIVRFAEPVEPYLEQYGHTPLPPYIHTPLADPERYQTVYARLPGSAAAPTAGLHFTPELISRLGDQGVLFARITLHVGLDTFAPVNEASPEEHKIHTEWCELTPETAEAINRARQAGGRIIAVGTTSVRTLESAARRIHRPASAGGIREAPAVGAFSGNTDLFILPGYHFQAVDTLITNFHLPRSTLIMLVSAFAGRERVLNAYQLAIQQEYRFYSFGDAMLIL